MTGKSPAPGLYVHIPFCRSRCGYCTFVSGIYEATAVATYLDALEREFEAKKQIFACSPPSSLFIGGGTPSCLGTQALKRLFRFLPATSGEASCEINPDSADRDVLHILKDNGITRISIGVQSFSDKALQILGRRHTGNQAITTAEEAKSMGFESVSLDLINGWPGQDKRSLEKDLHTAIQLGADHISCYNLIVEDTASGFERLSSLLDSADAEESRGREFWDITESVLQKASFNHYETSNFALPGMECRHNCAIWKGGEYVGVGLAAHSYLGGRRFANTDNMTHYLASSPIASQLEAFSERLQDKEAAQECAVFWFRLFEGICLQEFQGRTGWDLLDLYSSQLPEFLEKGIMSYNQERTHIRITEEFQPILDSILVDLI